MEILAIIVFSLLVMYYLYGTYISAAAMFNKRLIWSLRAACLMRVISFVFVLAGVGLFIAAHLKEEIITYSYKNGVVYEHSSYGDKDTTLMILFLIGAVLVLASIPLDSAGHDKRKRRIKNAMVSLILCAAVVVIAMAVVFANYHNRLGEDYSPKFYRCDSPDKSHSIIICERTHKNDGFGDIFQVKDQRAVKIGEFTTDNAFRNDGKYRIGWEKNQVTVFYSYNEKTSAVKKVTMKFAEI